ncbi:MAG: NAD(P)/FAD-dependent oxidoreductase, partial [Chloroflexi bacterium]|nr:NAD(P)/FAD-dependent oxidoreductase [Chloroflexota bacterium]
METRFDIVIVGSGPAGSSTARHLARHAPELAARTLLLDKATHPRPKLCGGGLTFYGRAVLSELGLRIPGPHIPLHHVCFRFADRQFILHLPHAFWVLRRDEFDAWLAGEARARGVTLQEGEAARGLERDVGGLLVHTDRATYRVRAVVAADGSRGTCRRAVQGEVSPPPVARLLETLTPQDAAQPAAAFTGAMATFDFTPVARGVQGYYWDFPSLVAGQPVLNRGIFDSRVRKEQPPAPLRAVLARSLRERGGALDEQTLQGHPIRWFDPRAPLAAPHVL